jgi:hypothetical protein
MKWHKMSPFPTRYCLTTFEDLKEWGRKNKIPIPELPEENIGSTIRFGGCIAIVIRPEKHKNRWKIVDTCIHESVHIFQQSMSYIGETVTGDEAEAYHIAAIATNILKDYYALYEKREEGLQA